MFMFVWCSISCHMLIVLAMIRVCNSVQHKPSLKLSYRKRSSPHTTIKPRTLLRVVRDTMSAIKVYITKCTDNVHGFCFAMLALGGELCHTTDCFKNG
jgi:hypothetical protein